MTSHYNLAGVPVEAGQEGLNFSIVGGAGTGKALLVSNLIAQARALGRRMVIHDTMGFHEQRFFRPDHDLILDPFDLRCCAWHFVAAAASPAVARGIAEALTIGVVTSPRFWHEVATTLLADALSRLNEVGMPTPEALHQALRLPDDQLAEFLTDKTSAKFFKAQKSAAVDRVREYVDGAARALLAIPTKGATFAVHEWLQDSASDACVFLRSSPEIAPALCGLHAAFVEVAIQEQLRRVDGPEDRLWLMLDELPALAQIPSLVRGVTQGRRHGLVTVGTGLSYEQLGRAYGDVEGRELLCGLQNRVVFRIADPADAKQCAEWLGDDLTAAELMRLAPWAAVVSRAGDYPVCRVDVPLGTH